MKFNEELELFFTTEAEFWGDKLFTLRKNNATQLEIDRAESDHFNYVIGELERYKGKMDENIYNIFESLLNDETITWFKALLVASNCMAAIK